MNYTEFTLDNMTTAHFDNFLQSLRCTFVDIEEVAAEWVEMEEAEQMHFRQEFTRSFGLRRLLGVAYRANRLNAKQIDQLLELDTILLKQAALLETVYHLTLRQLLHNLFTWGTPLNTYTHPLHIETTGVALAELALA